VLSEHSVLVGVMKGLRLAASSNALNMQAPMGQEGMLGIEGTVNSKETMLTWNTVPPTYWIKASVLENRGPFEKKVKSNAKYAEQRERRNKKEAKIQEGLNKKQEKAKSEKAKKEIKRKRERANKQEERTNKQAEAQHNKNLCVTMNQGRPCTENLCGPFKGKGYVAAPTSSNCAQDDQSICAVSCGLSMVYPKHKKYKELFHKHGWPKELVHPAEKPDVCADSFDPNFYYWNYGAAAGVAPSGGCASLCTASQCTSTAPLSNQLGSGELAFNKYSNQKFCELFCKKTCGFAPPQKCHTEWADERSAKQAERSTKENSAKAQAKETKCKGQFGLKGGGSSDWANLNVQTRRLLGSGHLSTMGQSTGDCHDYNGNFIGRGPCVTFNNGATPPKAGSGLWKARRRRTAWETTECQAACANGDGGAGTSCYAYNGAYHVRRRAGRTYCMLYNDNSKNCPAP